MPTIQSVAAVPDNLIPYKSVLQCSAGATTVDSQGQQIIKLENSEGQEDGSAEIILDYGRCESGLPVFEILSASSSTSTPNEDVAFRVIYSETREGIEHDTGDGPYFLFSSAMSSYRSIVHSISPPSSTQIQILQARHVQGSQRYQRLVLLSPCSSIRFRRIGFSAPLLPLYSITTPTTETTTTGNEFSIEGGGGGSALLSKIHATSLRTVELCTLPANSVIPAWDVVSESESEEGEGGEGEEGTKVHGGHWAPLRQGTRWGDYLAKFDVKIPKGGRGASWGVWMVANGVVFCLDLEGDGCGEQQQTTSSTSSKESGGQQEGERKQQQQQQQQKKAATATARVEVFEGLADKGGIFPPRRVCEGWDLPEDIAEKVKKGKEWVKVEVRTCREGGKIDLWIEGVKIGGVEGIDLRPLLGGSENNTGSVAFGGPEGWEAVYRDLEIVSSSSSCLYKNSLGKREEKRTLRDFQVGTNELACTVDGAKRDRAVFGGDLYVMGQAVAYSPNGLLDAIKGSIRLLTSHQTAEGYLGNLCPVQAPVHERGGEGNEESPPTYAFYSMTYALLLTVAIKDYWLHSGDEELLQEVLPRLEKLMEFVAGFVGEKTGLVEAPIPLSMHWFPLGGPIFGASAPINLSYLDALRSMALITKDKSKASDYLARADILKSQILTHLHDPSTCITRLSTLSPADGFCQDVVAYAATLGLVSPSSSSSSPSSSLISSLLSAPSSSSSSSSSNLPPAFSNLTPWDKFHVVSPYATGFAVEALFRLDEGRKAVELMERVWGPMTTKEEEKGKEKEGGNNNENYSGANWEAMTLEGKPNMHDCSLAHGWSSWPAFLLPKYLAGLRPLDAGWRRFGVEPVLAGLGGKVEGKAGGVRVRVEIDEEGGEGAKGEIEVECPEGKEGRIRPPKGWGVVGFEKGSGDGRAENDEEEGAAVVVVVKGPTVVVVRIEKRG